MERNWYREGSSLPIAIVGSRLSDEGLLVQPSGNPPKSSLITPVCTANSSVRSPQADSGQNWGGLSSEAATVAPLQVETRSPRDSQSPCPGVEGERAWMGHWADRVVGAQGIEILDSAVRELPVQPGRQNSTHMHRLSGAVPRAWVGNSTCEDRQ